MKDICGHEGLYAVTNTGSVWSYPKNTNGNNKGKWLKQSVDKNGYTYFTLFKGKKSKKHKAHRLVAQAFIPNRDNKSQVNHIDGDKTNNFIENLEWCSPNENTKHAIQNNLIKLNKQAKLTIDQASDICEAYGTGLFKQRELAECFNVCQTTISAVVRGKSVNLL